MIDENIIKEFPLFAKLDREECRKLAALCEIVQYKAGEIVFEQNSRGDSLQIIKQGKIEISLCLKLPVVLPDSTLAVLEAGKFFGTLSFLDSELHSAMAKALEDTLLIQLSKEDFKLFCEDNPHGGYLILHEIGVSIAHIVRETSEKIGEIRSYLLG